MAETQERIEMDFYTAKKLIRELNAAELKRKWGRFLKRQANKNAKQSEQTEMQ